MRNLLNALLVCALVACGTTIAIAQDKAPASDKAAVNLNTATVAQLEDLPGIGRSTAERIIEYRQKNGGFKKIEEILEISQSVRCLLTKSFPVGVQRDPESLQKSQEISRGFAVGGRSGGRSRVQSGGSPWR
jgi:competence ComEA-like helix-hairpin-helix protein